MSQNNPPVNTNDPNNPNPFGSGNPPTPAVKRPIKPSPDDGPLDEKLAEYLKGQGKR